MGLFNWFQKKPRQLDVKARDLIWPLPEGSFLEYAFGNFGRISPRKAMEFYRTNSTIATCVDKIASRIEQITPVLKNFNDDKIITDHEVLKLLKKPNQFNSWPQFIGKLSRHYLLTHDSHLVLLGNQNRPPLEMYALKPQNVLVNQAPDNFPISYQVGIGPGIGVYNRSEINRTARFFAQNFKEIYHIMGFSSRDEDLYADSPLEAAAMEAKQQIKGRYHNLSLLENGGRLSLVFAFKDDDGLSDDEYKIRKKRIYEDLSGSGNAGKIAVISGSEVDVREVGVNNKDMDFAGLEDIASKAIYLRYEIPLPLVSMDASTYNNYQTAILDFYESTILPLVDTLFAGLTRALFSRYNAEDYYLSYDPENIKVLMRQAIAELEQRKRLNIETTNELRMFLPGRESIEGGSVLYQPATLVPIGQDLFTGDETDPEELARKLTKRDGIEN